jgi:ABC-type cobalamin transport system ATPase subunit
LIQAQEDLEFLYSKMQKVNTTELSSNYLYYATNDANIMSTLYYHYLQLSQEKDSLQENVTYLQVPYCRLLTDTSDIIRQAQ